MDLTDLLNPFNDLAKEIFRQQPIIIVLFLIFIFLLLIFYATRTVSKQNSEDHKEKGQLIELIKDSNAMFARLGDAIDSLKVAQEKRNENHEIQISEQKQTNNNLRSLNNAFADYHGSLTDTITTILKNQFTTRLDNVETKVDDIYHVVTSKSDCNDEVLNRLNGLGRDIENIKTFLVNEKVKELEDIE